LSMKDNRTKYNRETCTGFQQKLKFRRKTIE